MDHTDIAWLDATAQAQLVADREVSPLELVEGAIARIEKLNPDLNAVIYERFADARERAAGNAVPDGPFRGVPFLMKDAVQTVAGEPVSMGWKTLKDLDYRAPQTTYVAQKFIESGLITLGQTTVPLWGASISAETEAWGATRNPWNLAHAVGGSSSGAAAAVASSMVPLAHGNDAAGSIRIPAAFCGLVGLKASRGRTSAGPLYSDYWNLSCEEGVLARSVRDVATAMDVIQGYEPGDPYLAPPPVRPYRQEIGRDPGRLRIGFRSQSMPELPPASDDAVAALDAALALLGSLGHEVEASHPPILDQEGALAEIGKLVACHMAAGTRFFGDFLQRPLRHEEFDDWSWGPIEKGRATSAAEYIAFGDWRNVVTRGAASWWGEGFDILAVPTVAAAAPAIGEMTLRPGEAGADMVARMFGYIPFTPIWNITGQPAISLPLHMTPAGLPLGVMFVAAYGREDLLFRLAAQLEEASPWGNRRPPISAPAA